MPLDKTVIIKQIDDVLAKSNPSTANDGTAIGKALSMMLSTINRFAPQGSVYANSVKSYEAYFTGTVIQMSLVLEPVRGVLEALRHDYEFGYLQSVVELVHADIFADLLEMANYLLDQGYKDPAAVVTGSVLETHLRKLAGKHGISAAKPDGSPKKADTLNSELAANKIYNILVQKSVTAWLDLRNKAAHGKYTEYTKEQVILMLQGIQDFGVRHPA